MNRPEPKPAVGAIAATRNEPQHAYPLGRWTVFKNPFSRKAAPPRPSPPVQSELSLDTLKVVRNDLSDADLEIVQAAKPVAPPPPAPPPPAPPPPAASTEPVPAGLFRITARIFGRT